MNIHVFHDFLAFLCINKDLVCSRSPDISCFSTLIIHLLVYSRTTVEQYSTLSTVTFLSFRTDGIPSPSFAHITARPEFFLLIDLLP